MRDNFSFGEIRRRVIDELEINRAVIESLFADLHECDTLTFTWTDDTTVDRPRRDEIRPGTVWISIKMTLNRGYLKSSFQCGVDLPDGQRRWITRHFNQSGYAAGSRSKD